MGALIFRVCWNEVEHLAIEHLARRARCATIVSRKVGRFGRSGMGSLVARKVESLALARRRVRCGGPPLFVGTRHRVVRPRRVYHHGNC